MLRPTPGTVLGRAAARDSVLSSLIALESELSSDSSMSDVRAELHRFGSWLQLEIRGASFTGRDIEGKAAGEGASILSSIVNLAKTCLGTGILTLPYAFKGCGLVWGVGFTLLTGGIASFTLFLLAEVAAVGGPSPTLNGIGNRVAGTPGRMLVDLSVCANNLGAMISYLVIASTTVQRLVHQNLLMNGWPRQAYVGLGVALIAPLCFVRRVNMLRFSSSVAMVALGLVTLMIVLFAMPWHDDTFARCTGGGSDCTGSIDMSAEPIGILTQFVIFTNAYTCQHAMLPIVAELDRPTRARKCAVIFGAMGAVCSLLLVVGVSGYITFGDQVESNVLFSYPHDSMFVVLALVGIIIDVLSSYPLLMFMTRIAIANLLRAAARAGKWTWLDDSVKEDPDQFGTPSSMAAMIADNDEPDGPPVTVRGNDGKEVYVVSPMQWSDFISDRVDLVATALIMLLTISVALAVSDLGIVAALTGATGATLVGYVCPGLLYWMVCCRQADSSTENALEEFSLTAEGDAFEISKGARVGAMAMLVLGCVLIPAGVTLTLTQ